MKLIHQHQCPSFPGASLFPELLHTDLSCLTSGVLELLLHTQQICCVWVWPFSHSTPLSLSLVMCFSLCDLNYNVTFSAVCCLCCLSFKLENSRTSLEAQIPYFNSPLDMSPLSLLIQPLIGLSLKAPELGRVVVPSSGDWHSFKYFDICYMLITITEIVSKHVIISYFGL